MAMSEAACPAKRNNVAAIVTSMSARTSKPLLKQPVFNWKSQYKYNKLLNFEIEVENIFMAKICDNSDSEGVPIIMNWLDMKDSISCKH